jgi:hypothetical protein
MEEVYQASDNTSLGRSQGPWGKDDRADRRGKRAENKRRFTEDPVESTFIEEEHDDAGKKIC